MYTTSSHLPSSIVEHSAASLEKFDKNVKDLLVVIYFNYTIIIDKVERHEYYVHHLFRDILSDTNSTLNCFIELTKDDWYTGSEVLASDHIINSNRNTNTW